MNSYPRVEAVKPLRDKCLLVVFSNGVKKVYDCKPLLANEIFSPLTDDILFRCVKTDQGGYGISWNDEVDLSESELWLHGVPAELFENVLRKIISTNTPSGGRYHV